MTIQPLPGSPENQASGFCLCWGFSRHGPFTLVQHDLCQGKSPPCEGTDGWNRSAGKASDPRSQVWQAEVVAKQLGSLWRPAPVNGVWSDHVSTDARRSAHAMFKEGNSSGAQRVCWDGREEGRQPAPFHSVFTAYSRSNRSLDSLCSQAVEHESRPTPTTFTNQDCRTS